MVCILGFANGARWMSRIRLSPVDREANRLLHGEFDCIQLVRKLTRVSMYGYRECANLIGSPFILMKYLRRDAAVDLNDHLIHPERKSSFYSSIAEYQMEETQTGYTM